MKNYEIINLLDLGDSRGHLSVLEIGKCLPFSPKRVFYIYDVPENETRGEHANLKSEFIMVALNGSVTVDVEDETSKDSFILDSPTKALYLKANTWKTMRNFIDNAVLLVIASTKYDKNEYINNYNEFVQRIKK